MDKPISKLKLFIENFLVYGLGGVISKIIPLVMVPVVTRIMPDTSYYGISDLSNTVVSLCSALAVMGMYDAMYRMFFEKDDEGFKKDICSTALAFTVCTSAVVFIIMLLFRNIIADFIFKDGKLNYLVYITAAATLAGATNSIAAAPTRMQNKRKIYLAMNTLGPLLSYSISIPLLLKGHYIIALPLAGAISAFTCEIIFILMNRKWFDIKRFRTEYLKPLLSIAVPLIPNFMIYWVFNSSDKLMITHFMDTAATGIYSVGSKLGHCSQLIYMAFSGGWQFFAFSTMREKDQVRSNSAVFEYLGVISFVCSMFVFSLSEPIFKLLFEGEYIKGYIAAPYLFLAPLLQMLFQIAGNQFLVIKKTWPISLILCSGAVINVFLNLFLIPKIGIEGAAAATLTGYAVSDIICMIVLCSMKLMIVSKRFVFSAVITIAYILLWRFLMIDNILLSLISAIAAAAIFFALYFKDLLQLFRSICKKSKEF